MAIRTFDELMASIKERTEGMTDDETLAFIEDVNDTLTDARNKTQDNTNWKEKYEENDKEWREKYRERFFSDEPSNYDEDSGFKAEEKVEKTRFEDLFSFEEV